MSNNNPKPDFNALFKLGTFTVNVPTNVNNANVNPSENNVVKTNGEYNVPNDKTGWNSFSVNVTPTITPNVADLMITNDVYDYVKKNHDGMVILPGNDPTVVEETMFDTHGKDYATSVIIDLNFLKTELKIDPNHQKIRLSEDEEDFEVYDYEKDGDYDVRVKPKPEPEPTKNKSRFITFKSNTRDIIEDDPSYRNIGSFTIIAPILNSIVLPAGTYTFDIGIYNNENNTDYLGVKTITFTSGIPSSLNKTIEINTIQNNVSTLFLPQNEGEKNIMPVLSSNISSNKVTLIVDNENYYKNDLYCMFDNNNNTYYPNTNGSNNYFIVQWNDEPQVVNKITVDCYFNRNSRTFHFTISGSNDNENYTQLYDGLCDTEGNWKTFDLLLDNNMNNAYTYYKIYSYITDGNPWDNSSRLNNMKFIQYGTYQYYDSFTIINKTASDLGTPIMQSYNTNNQTVSVSTSNTNIQSNFTGNINVPLESKTIEINSPDNTTTITPSNNYYGLSNVIVTTNVPTSQPKLEEISGYEYTSNGSYGIRTNWGYDGIKSVDFRINVPQTLYTYPTITTNGTYIIPENYVGLNVIKVNIDPNNPNPPNPPAKPTKEATEGETIMLENNTYWSGLRRRNSNGEYIAFGGIGRNFNGIYINNWSSPEYNTFILSREYGTGMTEFILFTIKNNIEANYPITIVNDLTNEYTYKNEWTNDLETIYGMYVTDTPSYHTYPGFTTYGPVNDLANFDSSYVNVSSLLKTTLYIEIGTD